MDTYQRRSTHSLLLLTWTHPNENDRRLFTKRHDPDHSQLDCIQNPKHRPCPRGISHHHESIQHSTTQYFPRFPTHSLIQYNTYTPDRLAHPDRHCIPSLLDRSHPLRRTAPLQTPNTTVLSSLPTHFHPRRQQPCQLTMRHTV